VSTAGQHLDFYLPPQYDPLDQPLSALVVDRALDKLPSIYADVLRLVRDGFTHSEIAERLGIPVGTVKSRMAKATPVMRAGLLADIAADRERRATRRVMPSTVRLLTAASRLLPAADRARYAEEFLSELWDLAQSGDGRRQQLRYTLRQFRGILSMSFALRSPRRRGAVP